MEGLDADVGSLDAALQQRPEILDAVRVDVPLDIPLGVVTAEVIRALFFVFPRKGVPFSPLT